MSAHVPPAPPDGDQVSSLLAETASKASALTADELERIERQAVADYLDAGFEKLEGIIRQTEERAHLRRALFRK